MRIIFFLIFIFLGLCFLLLITDRGVLISEKKEGYILFCKYFSGRNTFGKSWFIKSALVRTDKKRDYCPFISKP